MWAVIFTIIFIVGVSIFWIILIANLDLHKLKNKKDPIIDYFEEQREIDERVKMITISQIKQKEVEQYLEENPHFELVKNENQAMRKRIFELKLLFLKIINTGLFYIERVLESNELEDEEKTLFYKVSNWGKEVYFWRSALRYYVKFKLVPQKNLSTEENAKLVSSNIVFEVEHKWLKAILRTTIEEIKQMYNEQEEKRKAEKFIEETSILDHLDFPEMKEEFVKAQKLVDLQKSFEKINKS